MDIMRLFKKKGQITLFILIGAILILGLISLSYYRKSDISEIQIDTVSFDIYVNKCLDEKADDILIEMGFQAGSTDPEHYIEIYSGKTAYAYYDDVYILPTIEDMQKDISQNIEKEIIECINFSLYEKQGYNISYSLPNASTWIFNESVYIDLNFLIKIKKDNLEKEFSRFSIKKDIRLGTIHSIAEDIIKRTFDSDHFDPDIISQYDAEIDVRGSNNQMIVFDIIDNRSVIKDGPYYFRFGVHYDNPMPYTKYLAIEDLEEEITLNPGKIYQKQLSYESSQDEGVVFDSISDLFQITKDGIITINATEFDIGEHTATILLEDSSGNTDYATMVINIEE